MILDFIAASLALTGTYLVGCKNKYGFLVCFASGLSWCVVAYFTGVYGLFLEVVPLFVLNLYNFFKWKKSEKTNNVQ